MSAGILLRILILDLLIGQTVQISSINLVQSLPSEIRSLKKNKDTDLLTSPGGRVCAGPSVWFSGASWSTPPPPPCSHWMMRENIQTKLRKYLDKLSSLPVDVGPQLAAVLHPTLRQLAVPTQLIQAENREMTIILLIVPNCTFALKLG